MIFRTVIQDCLCLNWAVPAEVLPPPPPPLSHDVLKTADGDFVFVSVMLFRQERLLPAAHLPRLSQPQCQFHTFAVDGDGRDCRWVSGILLPTWLAASVRWVAGRPARGARLHFPALGAPGCSGDHWRWAVAASGRLDVEAKLGGPSGAQSPSLGSWQKTVAYFRKQRSEYVLTRGKWQQVHVERQGADAIPVAVEVVEDRLVMDQLGASGGSMPQVHSSWLVPTIKTSFEYASEREAAGLPGAPAPL